MTTRSRSRSTRWPSAASATSRSSRTGAPPASSRRATSSTTSPRPSTDVVMAPRIAILAQDLIWSDRLARAVEAAGAVAARAKTASEFDAALERAEFAIVDLTARAYDAVTAIERAHATGRSRARRRAARRHRSAQAGHGSRRRARVRLPQAVRGRARHDRDLDEPSARRRTGRMISERPTVPASRFAERLERAVAATQEGDLEALLIGVGLGPALPDRLRGDAARAPDDARPVGRAGTVHRRAAARARPRPRQGRPSRSSRS